ncbi:hypothetical protein DAD99_21025 [Pseudarthrobacter sp. AB1]|nr:hypothetical protein [Pseudarthrobacter sp. AB1]
MIAPAPHDVMGSLRSHEKELHFIEENLSEDERILAAANCGLVTARGFYGVVVVTERRAVVAIRNDNNPSGEPIVETFPLANLSVQDRQVGMFHYGTFSAPGRSDFNLEFIGELEWYVSFFDTLRQQLNRAKFS